MNTIPLISHRLFVAAIKDANGLPSEGAPTEAILSLLQPPDSSTFEAVDYPPRASGVATGRAPATAGDAEI